MATVKTALSIDESLFERAEALADELDVPRSRVFAMALEEFLRKYEGQKLMERIDAVYADEEKADEREATSRRTKHRELVEDSW